MQGPAQQCSYRHIHGESVKQHNDYCRRYIYISLQSREYYQQYCIYASLYIAKRALLGGMYTLCYTNTSSSCHLAHNGCRARPRQQYCLCPVFEAKDCQRGGLARPTLDSPGVSAARHLGHRYGHPCTPGRLAKHTHNTPYTPSCSVTYIHHSFHMQLNLQRTIMLNIHNYRLCMNVQIQINNTTLACRTSCRSMYRRDCNSTVAAAVGNNMHHS